LTPSVSEEAQLPLEKISLIRNKIIAKEITFAEAARTESDQKKETNGGSLINPKHRILVLS
jgi:peptidyl-prolyl cis-trans isomerase SurA